ncbi:MAG: glutamine--fructose-6-phosphate transaminase (isomerizing) [Candidatus Sumerlaeia bacterium]|nr:glutamine--fructose-6-phosphate transaminase (isomerizing) [Candidatus Sumerlaeia bacterium]
MCGIVGYLGPQQAAPILLAGLRRLEYRGYDSAGLAVLNPQLHLERRRTVGAVAELERSLQENPLSAHIGISHTRWATHGAPSERNAHPHLDASGRIAVVHNGIIENYRAIRTYLEGFGIVFQSDTDTEAIVQLIGFHWQRSSKRETAEDFERAVRLALLEVEGAFGVAILSADFPELLIAARRGSPLLLGIGDREYFLASDGGAIIEHTNQVVYLEDNELLCIHPWGYNVSTLDSGRVEKEVSTLELTLEEIELGAYQHFMHKEIHEQPKALANTLAGRVDTDGERVILAGLESMERDLGRIRRILLFGCGTAWHASLVGEYLLEDLARIPCTVEYASELRYRNPIIEEGTLAIVVSQSGETADSLAALREVKLKGATAFGVVNTVGSSIARETDAGVYLHVGQEVGVASTKAFTAQVAVLALIATDLGRRRHLSPERTHEVLSALKQIPDQVEQALETEAQIRRVVERFHHRPNWLYLGRGVNYPVALEGALKLKEISYIHAEGMPAAEMKHGPIALIEEGMPVVFVAPRDHTYEKVLSNMEEVRGRGGRIIAVASRSDRDLTELADEIILVPETLSILSPLLTSVPLQLLAYHAALIKGLNVDKPRNLAKSVTVE